MKGMDEVDSPVQHASITVIIAAHRAFNERRLDELEVLMHEEVDLFTPVALGLRPSSQTGITAFRATIAAALAAAPDLNMGLDRAEVVGDLVILACIATATGTDGKTYQWPLRVLVAEDQGRITRYVVRAPEADITSDLHAFKRIKRGESPA